MKEYAVEHFNYRGGLLTDGRIDEMDLSDLILEHVKHGRGMTTSWESLEVEVSGRQDGYLTEIHSARFLLTSNAFRRANLHRRPENLWLKVILSPRRKGCYWRL